MAKDNLETELGGTQTMCFMLTRWSNTISNLFFECHCPSLFLRAIKAKYNKFVLWMSLWIENHFCFEFWSFLFVKKKLYPRQFCKARGQLLVSVEKKIRASPSWTTPAIAWILIQCYHIHALYWISRIICLLWWNGEQNLAICSFHAY